MAKCAAAVPVRAYVVAHLSQRLREQAGIRLQ
jgi:hypothetical protein